VEANMVTAIDSKSSATYVRRLEHLLDASRLLNSTLELSELTEIVLRIVQDEIPVDRCTLFVVDRKQELLRSFIAQGVEEFEITLPLGEGLGGHAAVTGEPLDIEDAYADERFQQKFDEQFGYRTKDALCLPVFNCDGIIVGVLQLLNRIRPLNREDKEFLDSMCTYLGLALHNAWVHRELVESRKAEQELRQIRDRLEQAEKLSAMNELVAGIIHEMKNPLDVAIGYCSLMEEEVTTPVKERVRKVKTAVAQALKVAKNFLNFARSAGERVPTDVNSLISQTTELLTYDFRSRRVKLVCELDHLPLTWVDPGSIQQVLLNLLKNAHQAAGDKAGGGRISIRSSHNSERSTIRIEISDDGPGIPAEAQSRIFEPFFTTKPSGSGTGLGLAVSKRIIEAHWGKLTFESTPGQGATFIIELPVQKPTP